MMRTLSSLIKSLYLHRVAALAAGFFILADQLTKDIAQMLWFQGGPSIGIFSFRLSKNPGMALGTLGTLDHDFRVPLILLLSIVSAISIVLISRPFSQKNLLRGWGLALIFAGAISNGIDRLWHGHVIDFIEFHMGGMHVPSFNLADISVGIGALLVAFVVAHGATRKNPFMQSGGKKMEQENQTFLTNEELLPETQKKRPGVLVKMSPGTTLVEILIVVAIIGLVLGAVAIGVVPLFQKGQKQTAWNEAKTIEGMYSVWIISNPECPGSVDDLQRVAGKKGQSPTDPWGSTYEIRCPSENNLDIDIYSPGPDKKPGTDDDIGNWMPQPKD